MSVHPISAMVHARLARDILRFTPSTMLDIGGTNRFARLGLLPECEVRNANLLTGLDGTDLPFADGAFDVTVSVATVEHVPDHRAFLAEAFRVARIASFHWFPVGDDARAIEGLKTHHPCVIRDKEEILESLRPLDGIVRSTPYVTSREHLLLLATLYAYLNSPALYELADSLSGHYGTIFAVERLR